MFAVARTVVNKASTSRVSGVSARFFAQVVQAPSGSPDSSPFPHRRQKLTHILKKKVWVREDHGLWGFFRKKENADELEGEAKYEVVENPETIRKQTGE